MASVRQNLAADGRRRVSPRYAWRVRRSAPTPTRSIPADADVVISINVRQLVDSPAFQKYGKADAIQGLQNPQIQAILAALGVDPLKDVNSLLFTAAGDFLADNPKLLLVVRGTFDVDKIRGRASLFAAANPAGLKITQASGLTIYEGAAAGKTVYACLMKDGPALLASTDRDYLIQAVKNPSPGRARRRRTRWPSCRATARSGRGRGDGRDEEAAGEARLGWKQTGGEAGGGDGVGSRDERGGDPLEHLHHGRGEPDDAKGQLDRSKNFLLDLPTFQPGPFGPLIQDVRNNTAITKDGNSVQVAIRLTEDFLEKADKKRREAP